jgi:hypothetical protein
MDLTQAILAGVAPITIKFQLTSTISFTTSVFGENRDMARSDIYFGSALVYSVSMSQALPKTQLPFDIIYGGTSINEGGIFILTIPSEIQLGSVLAHITFVSQTGSQPAPFSAYIADWSASSLVDPATLAMAEARG